MPRKPSILRRRALRIAQNRKHPLFLFALTPKELVELADISRLSRDDAGKLIGYQRPGVKKHIGNIVEYLNGRDVLFPNSIILALASGINFRAARGPKVDEGRAITGTIEIPLPREGQPKPAWIVDGQQRVMALSRSRDQDLLVPVNGFVADDVAVQRDQFLRINSSKPLPPGLITELLPEVNTVLPPHLAARKVPAALCDLLATNPESPFEGLIKRPSTKGVRSKGAVITYTPVIAMLQESLTNTSGCLFPYRNLATGETDFEAVTTLLFMYWSAVRATFADAWGLPASKSRLMHGAGIRAMGRLMDKLMGAVNPSDPRAPKVVHKELAALAPHCRWTSGSWEEMDDRRWNEIQNTPQDVRLLSNHLVRLYLGTRQAAA